MSFGVSPVNYSDSVNIKKTHSLNLSGKHVPLSTNITHLGILGGETNENLSIYTGKSQSPNTVRSNKHWCARFKRTKLRSCIQDLSVLRYPKTVILIGSVTYYIYLTESVIKVSYRKSQAISIATN